MTDLRRCIGSARFGIEPHDAPVADFPSQPSQKSGLGRMCGPHWNAYTAGLARDAKTRKAASGGPAAGAQGDDTIGAEGAQPTASEPAPKRTRRASPTTASAGEGDAP